MDDGAADHHIAWCQPPDDELGIRMLWAPDRQTSYNAALKCPMILLTVERPAGLLSGMDVRRPLALPPKSIDRPGAQPYNRSI